jgi:hypothetical protein
MPVAPQKRTSSCFFAESPTTFLLPGSRRRASFARSSEGTGEPAAVSGRRRCCSELARWPATAMREPAPSPESVQATTSLDDGPVDLLRCRTNRRPSPRRPSYNNFYEFGTDKDEPARNAHTLQTRPWTVQVTGLVKQPKHPRHRRDPQTTPHRIKGLPASLCGGVVDGDSRGTAIRCRS